MCFSNAKGHMLILYMSYMKFSINQFVGNFCPLSSSMSAHPNCVQGKPDSYITSNLVKYAHVKLNVWPFHQLETI
jgi:hypothetical protein